MTKEKKFKRQCCFCKEVKDKKNLIRITKDFLSREIKINAENKIQGRSVYICKNDECIKNALKKKKIENSLKSELPENIKQELYTVLKN